MNFKRFLSYVLSVCVCLFALFLNSLIVYAEDDVDLTDDYYSPEEEWLDFVNSGIQFYDEVSTNYLFAGNLLYTSDYSSISGRDLTLTDWVDMTNSGDSSVVTYNWADRVEGKNYCRALMSLTDGNDSILLTDGQTSNIIINNLSLTYSLESYARFGSITEFYSFSYAYIYTDNSIGPYLDPDEQAISVNSDNTVNIIFSCTPDDDIKGIYLSMRWSLSEIENKSGVTLPNGTPIMFTFSANDLSLSVDAEPTEVGLLKSIVDWLKGIKDGISNLFDSIAELPSKIGNFLLDGLKNLFVPSDEYMSSYGDKWDSLLASRFGAVYEVFNIIIDTFKGLTSSDETDTINMPSVTLNFGDTPFTFGGYDVVIVPDGFSAVVEVLKKIVSIVCTYMFINGLRHRYDEVMGVEK